MVGIDSNSLQQSKVGLILEQIDILYREKGQFNIYAYLSDVYCTLTDSVSEQNQDKLWDIMQQLLVICPPFEEVDYE